MPIEDRNLKPGTHLVGRYHKERHYCEVVEGEGGKLRYRLADGREFKSPSAAGMAIAGHACDGWVFWSVETSQAAPTPEAPKTETADAGATKETPLASAPTPESTLAKKPFFRLPNQKGAPEGKVRWYCHECGQGFLAAPGEIPESCPQGHRI